VLSNTGYTSGGGNGLGINLNDPGNYTFTGSITGTAQGNQFRFTGGTGTLTLSGNASGLTTTSSNVGVRSGTLVLNNANAWAAGNSPASGWQVGNFSNNSTGGAQLLTNGFNVGGSIATNQATGSGNTSGDNVIIGGQHTTGSATFTGNVTIGRIVAGARKFQLTSAAGGTTVFLGVISDGASSGSASTVVPVEITGAGTVLLNGTNTYTGGTTVVSGATLGGTGTISGAVTVASGGKLAFTVASASKLTVGGALSFGGSNTLTITKSGTPGTGSYTLLTATGGITGTLPTLSLPVGWVATLQTSGNNLELVVTAAP
jgi:autotransporter-associated beta strand protein